MIPRASLIPSGLRTSRDGSADAELCALWLSTKTSEHTRRAYAMEIQRFLGEVQKPLVEVTLRDVQEWVVRLESGGLKPASVNRALTAVKSLLSFARQTGYLPYNVGAAVKLRPNRDSLPGRILEEAEVARLIEAGREGRDRMMIKLLYVSAIRVSELCGLKWSDLAPRTEGGQLTVYGKGGKTRSILLRVKVWQELISMRGGAGEAEAIFQSRKGGGSLDVSQVRRIVYAAARKAGLKKMVSPHWMRHAHASHALERKAPIHLVQATLGHASVATTGRYLHARPAESSGFYLPE